MKDYVKIGKWYFRYAAINAILPDTQDETSVGIYVDGCKYPFTVKQTSTAEVIDAIEKAKKEAG